MPHPLSHCFHYCTCPLCEPADDLYDWERIGPEPEGMGLFDEELVQEVTEIAMKEVTQ
jgi:hypothetical protein